MYDEEVDAWLDNGEVVEKANDALVYDEVPALWGADADDFALLLGGVVTQGQVTAITKAEHKGKFEPLRFMVVTGSINGDRYKVTGVENAPDGDAAVFVVAVLQRWES